MEHNLKEGVDVTVKHANATTLICLNLKYTSRINKHEN